MTASIRNFVYRRLIIGLAVLALAGLSAVTASAADIEVQKSLVYGKGGDVDLQLDLARPKGDGPYPAIVFIHGGGWRGGNRGRYRTEIEQAAKQGYVAITVTYRLTQPDKSGKAKYPFPAQVHDVKCAVRWLRANAKKFGVDPNRIGATGGSAGGHLSLMLGVTDATHKLEGTGGHADQSSRVQAVVNYYGPTDMLHLSAGSKGASPILASFLDGGPKEAKATYIAASPITYVSKDDPPTLTLHGAADRLVLPSQATRFDTRMKEVGANHRAILYEGQGHGFRGDTNQQARTAMYEFFDKHLKNVKKK
jgi:acetyl esterase/lipase